MNGMMQEDETKSYPPYIAMNERGVPAILQCAYLKMKGRPASEGINAWTKALSERIDEFEPLKGAPPKVDLRNRRSDEGDAASDPRMAVLIEAIGMLDGEKDFVDGKPKIEALRKLVDNNVTLSERNSAFALFQSRKTR